VAHAAPFASVPAGVTHCGTADVQDALLPIADAHPLRKLAVRPVPGAESASAHTLRKRETVAARSSPETGVAVPHLTFWFNIAFAYASHAESLVTPALELEHAAVTRPMEPMAKTKLSVV
jgi:hypothetical protein